MTVEIPEIINIPELKEHKNELEEWKEYIPLLLIGFVDSTYFNRWTEKAKIQYRTTRNNIPSENVDEYLINDLTEWVKKYPQFKDILK